MMDCETVNIQKMCEIIIIPRVPNIGVDCDGDFTVEENSDPGDDNRGPEAETEGPGEKPEYSSLKPPSKVRGVGNTSKQLLSVEKSINIKQQNKKINKIDRKNHVTYQHNVLVTLWQRLSDPECWWWYLQGLDTRVL